MRRRALGDAPSSLTWTDNLDQHVATVPASTGALIGKHRPLRDGGGLVFHSVQFTDQDGKQHMVEASLNKVSFPCIG